MKQIRFIDLFSGLGSFHVGMKNVFGKNAKCVFAADNNRHAANIYKENFGIDPYNDITKTKVNNIPDHDILFAGFPCQPFSNAGLKKGFNDIRGPLFFNIAKIVEYHKPQVVFLENVKGFQSHDKGNTFKVVTNT